ncbi:hypothetical protein GJAV_G00076910 [Gymnothorax javanicus]|nr:hypothetical protein GJAV_G00076910 [Gymnothorax javanicus]
MNSEKKLTMEDTWKTGDLEKYMRRGAYDEDNTRRKERRKRDEEGKKDRRGESERWHRDHEREAHKERDRRRARESSHEKTKPRDPDRDKGQARHREGLRDRTGEWDERDRERRREPVKTGEGDLARDGSRTRGRGHETWEKPQERVEDNRDGGKVHGRANENKDERRRHSRAEKDNKEGERRRAEQDRERVTEIGENRDREQIREWEREKDREHDYERRTEKEKHRDKESGHHSKHVKYMNDYKDERLEKYYESQRENERRGRDSDRVHSGRKEDKEYQEQHKEQEERRHRDRKEHRSKESRRHEAKERDGERERRHKEHRRGEHRSREHREEHQHHSSSHSHGTDRRPHDQPGNRRPTEEVVGESGLFDATSKASLERGRERTQSKETKDEKEEVEPQKTSAEDQEDEDGAAEYEDDFEDYEDDFDEVDESGKEEDDDGEKSAGGNEQEELSPQKRREIEEIRRAMNAENDRVRSSSQQRQAAEESERIKTTADSPQRKSSQHGRFMDFVAAQHREVGKKIASKQKKRSMELLRLIDLDFSVTFPLLDLPPVNEYDMYIKSFGTTNTKQAYVQCNEDNTDKDIQTEEIEVDDKWTQHPADGRMNSGGPKLINGDSDESMAKMNIDSKRLAEFLLSASQVVAVLLEEDRAEMHSLRKLKSQAHSLSCCDGCLQLNTKLPFLHGREVSMLCFSPVQRQTLLSVHSPASQPSAVCLDSKTILCIWNIWEPSRPQKVLIYESQVLCCCFSPGKATLVFAGTAVGSVVVWDLREHSSLHQTLTIGDEDWTLRHPTFSTDAVLLPLGHLSSVRSLEPVPAVVAEGSRTKLSLLSSHCELSFQVASLDENGVMNLWLVVELPKTDPAGSQTDLGLKPGGKVKLLHSSTLITNDSRSSQRDSVNTGPLRTLLLKFLPSNSNHFFIGTDMGLVTHGTRHGLKIPPKFYRSQEDGVRPVQITAVDVSPFGEPLFLVGCSDGSVRLHSVSSEQPLMEWSRSTCRRPVLSVQWALTRPTVFCVLDLASTLHVWDLLEKDYEPVTTERLHSDGITSMAVFGDPAKPNTLSGVSLATQAGDIEIQYFSKQWALPAPGELDALHNILTEAF